MGICASLTLRAVLRTLPCRCSASSCCLRLRFKPTPRGFVPPTSHKKTALKGCCFIGAGDGNRTHVISLEGWSSTIELHPHHLRDRSIYIFYPLVKPFYILCAKFIAAWEPNRWKFTDTSPFGQPQPDISFNMNAIAGRESQPFFQIKKFRIRQFGTGIFL